LARYFAQEGNSKAQKIIYQRYKNFSTQEHCHHNVEESLVTLDGLDGIVLIAEVYGREFEKDSEYWSNSNDIEEYQKENPHLNIIEILTKKAKKNKYIQFYLDALVQDVSEIGVRTKRPSYDYAWIKEKIAKVRLIPHFISKNLSQKEIKSLADDFIKEKNLEIKTKYLTLFRHYKFPYDFDTLLELASSTKPNRRLLKTYAREALSLFKSDKIRAYAIEKLKHTTKPAEYTQLLIHNYKEGDEVLLKNIVSKYHNIDKIHNLIYSYLEIYRNNLNADFQAIFEIFYERMNCGVHRYDIVELMYENDILSESIKEELEFDSDEDIRKFFKKIKV